MNDNENVDNGDLSPKENERTSPFASRRSNRNSDVTSDRDAPVTHEASVTQESDEIAQGDPALDEDLTANNGEIARKRNIILVGAAIFAAVLAVIVVIAISFTKPVVPNAAATVGMTDDDEAICAEFVDESLDCHVEWKINEDKPRGALISQSLPADEKVEKNSHIDLVYSNGPSESSMPELKGLTLEEAEAALYSANVTIEEVSEVAGAPGSEGKIVTSSVAAEAPVKNGESVVLQVSNGKAIIPDWTNQTKEYVEAEAEKLGIAVTFKTEESEKASDLVISQTPIAGETAGTEPVEVVVSKAFESREIKIPDVVGKSAEDAQSELATAGFRQIKTVVVQNSEVTSTQVTQVVPGVGQTGKSEENIVIIVSEPNK